ncbi:MAG TPA: PAS domain-containing protein [Dongiaceae bacterium]|nr:PAS domain-containing protein [Dongiaceae bacterium]
MAHEDPCWHSKAALERPELANLLETWRRWAAVQSIPLRPQFDPIDFPRLLPWMVLAEVLSDAPFDARIRYLGSEFVHYFDSGSLTGKRLSDLEPVFVKRWSEVGEKVVAARTPQFFHGAPFMVDKAFVQFEMLALPLSKAGQAVDFVILAMAMNSTARG